VQAFPRPIERVLIVEDNEPLRAAIAGLVRSWNAEALEAGTVREAVGLLSPPPDLLICDVKLPDASVFSLLEATLSLCPEPAKIAISGLATPEEAFQLGQVGVREYLAKPFTLADLSEAVRRVLTEPPNFDPLLRASVGRVPMRELQKNVRSVMVEQALALSHGSRSGAARLLDVSRQAVQQILRGSDERLDFELPSPGEDAPKTSSSIGSVGGSEPRA
jgi:DNA-binding NtrC family response regulator